MTQTMAADAANTQTVGQNARTLVLSELVAGIGDGLNAPNAVRFYDDMVHISFDSATDLNQWAQRFEFCPHQHGQPHPDLADPANSDRWIVSNWSVWNGVELYFRASDPITDEQRQQWIDSGSAARHATDAAK